MSQHYLQLQQMIYWYAEGSGRQPKILPPIAGKFTNVPCIL